MCCWGRLSLTPSFQSVAVRPFQSSRFGWHRHLYGANSCIAGGQPVEANAKFKEIDLSKKWTLWNKLPSSCQVLPSWADPNDIFYVVVEALVRFEMHQHKCRLPGNLTGDSDDLTSGLNRGPFSNVQIQVGTIKPNFYIQTWVS
ncbi:MAG: hypothetical protein GY820_10945 [Gammaproteobacteria bacterium]|nr:hypothetical protein [Gammaproteobacteria bacterium]